MSFSITLLPLALLVTLGVAYPSDTGDDNSPSILEQQENSTFAGPVANLKHSLTALNSKIQEDTLKAFEEVNQKLKSGVASFSSSHQAFDYPTSFSNEIGTVENIVVEGLSNITIVQIATDLFSMGSEFKLLIHNISIEATVKLNENENLERITIGVKSLSATVIDVSFEGTAGLVLKSKNKKDQLIYNKFLGKQRARAGFQMQAGQVEEQQEVDALLEEQITKSLLLSALDNVMKTYLSAVQKSANSKLMKIDVESYLPGDFAKRYFQGIASLHANGGLVNGYDFLSGLYTRLIKEYIDTQLNNLDPITKSIRRKQTFLENTWVFGIFSLTEGTISGLSSVSIAVGNAIDGSPQPNTNGVVKFGSLTFQYRYTIEYFVGGYETGYVTISTYGVTANYEEKSGTTLISIKPADINLQQLTFSGPSRELQTAQSQTSVDWRVGTVEEQVKVIIRQKMATLISNGLNSIYF